MHIVDRAAHDALQTRDRPELRRVSARSLSRSRICGAPLRALRFRSLWKRSGLRSRCAASGTRGGCVVSAGAH